jgi:hypothetical protein
MNLYEQDNGIYGMIVVVAENFTDARSLMVDCLNYNESKPIVEHHIRTGLVLCNYGDM